MNIKIFNFSSEEQDTFTPSVINQSPAAATTSDKRLEAAADTAAANSLNKRLAAAAEMDEKIAAETANIMRLIQMYELDLNYL